MRGPKTITHTKEILFETSKNLIIKRGCLGFPLIMNDVKRVIKKYIKLKRINNLILVKSYPCDGMINGFAL